MKAAQGLTSSAFSQGLMLHIIMSKGNNLLGVKIQTE